MKDTARFLGLYLCFSIILIAETTTNSRVFYNYTRDLDDAGSNAFNIKRGYLTFINNASETVVYKLTYDVGANDAGSSYTAFLKVAMVKWKTKLGDITIGMQGMNMYKTMENTWGHRFIAKGAMGYHGFSPSADAGIGVTRGFGSITTSALVTYGEGYKRVESDKHKKLSLHAVYGQQQLNKTNGFNFGGSLSLEPYDTDDSKIENLSVVGLFSGYAGFGFRGGLEFANKNNGSITAQIISLYGTYDFSDRFSFLARLDQVDSNTSNPGGGTQAIIMGLHCSLGHGMIVAPTLRMTTPENEKSENSVVVNFEFKF